MKSKTLGFLGYGPSRASKPLGLATTVAFVVGALLVLWSAYIHFHLWNETDGYRHISIIGPLFLAQSIGGVLLAIVILAFRRVWTAMAGVGYGLSTVVGFLLTVGLSQGLFNFKESWSAPFAAQAFAIEIAAAAVLLAAGALCLAGSASKVRSGSDQAERVPSGA